MSADVLGRVQQVGADVFACEPVRFQMDTVADDIDGWDSLSHTIFIMAVEKEFGIRFNPRTIFAFSNVGDLTAEIRRLQA